ncbi:MAG: T9SS type A sorting domain-containing protein [Ignavibacteria bacterium]|nr:T9SS type A sorting domain-containing protein [Ignavibacteria bacterium]
MSKQGEYGSLSPEVKQTTDGMLETAIDMSNFTVGTYFVRLKNGKSNEVEKFIKK